jgi:hypothetical protein
MATQTSHSPAERPTRQSHWLSGRVAVWIAFGLGMASLIFSLWMLPNTSLYLADETNWLVVGILLLDGVTLLSPALILIGAMRSTARILRSQKRKPLPETGTSDKVSVRDLIVIALYRWRVLLALVIGTMPLVVFGLAHLSIEVNLVFFKVFGCFSSYDYDKGCYDLVSVPGAVSTDALLALLALTVGLWGLCLFAASLGVRLAAWWSRVYPLTLIMPMLLILAATAGNAVLMLQAMAEILPIRLEAASTRTTSGLDYVGSQSPVVSGILLLSILVMLVTYALSAAIIVTAPRRVRNDEG